MSEPWTYSVRQGGLMRCCLQSLDDAMKKRLDNGDGRPAEGDRAKCDYHESWMIFRDGAWEWAKDEAAQREARP